MAPHQPTQTCPSGSQATTQHAGLFLSFVWGQIRISPIFPGIACSSPSHVVWTLYMGSYSGAIHLPFQFLGFAPCPRGSQKPPHGFWFHLGRWMYSKELIQREINSRPAGDGTHAVQAHRQHSTPSLLSKHSIFRPISSMARGTPPPPAHHPPSLYSHLFPPIVPAVLRPCLYLRATPLASPSPPSRPSSPHTLSRAKTASSSSSLLDAGRVSHRSGPQGTRRGRT